MKNPFPFLPKGRFNLRVKLPLSIITLLVLSFILVTVISVLVSRSALTETLKKSLVAEASLQVEGIRSHLVWTQSMAVDLSAAAEAINLDEEASKNVIAKMLSDNEQIIGSTIAYEPYKFKSDLQFWAPYYNRTPNDDKLVFTQLGTPENNYPAQDWYRLAKESNGVILSPPYFDAGGAKIWMVTWSVPFQDASGKLKGIATTDIAFSQTQEIVQEIKVGEKGYAFLVDPNGVILGIGAEGGQYKIMEDSALISDPSQQASAWNKMVNDMVKGGAGFVDLTDPQGKAMFVAYEPIGMNTGWSLGLAYPQVELFQPATQLQNTLIFFSVLILVIASVILLFLSRSITRPLQEITSWAKSFSQEKIHLGTGQPVKPMHVKTNDEIEDLADAFNQMSGELASTLSTLEQRVAERTRNLELAAEVGRTVSQVHALDVMLKDVAELIRKQFDLYYVQVYLTDPSQTNLMLQSGTGTVGTELIRRGHRLPLNTASINGRAAVEKQSVVISDTTASASFKPNPLLPNTRSEMAVPLLIGEKVVGVLNMQSEHAGSLSQDILPAFEAMAGQLAIAIQNATFLAETEQAHAEVEAQARRLSRANWVDYLDAIHKPEETGFVFEKNKIAPMTLDEQSQLQTNNNALSAPITVTGEELGNLVVEMEGQSPVARTSELVNTVARQVAQQIESLRLLESAERYRAEAEEASRLIIHEGWQDYIQANANEGMSYMYDLNEVKPYHRNGSQQSETADYTLPLKVRDETIGKLVVQGLDKTNGNDLELASAVAERLGAHLEGLRLSNQTEQALLKTQKLAEREQALRQITSAVRGSTDPATILRSAARELGTILGRKTIVRLTTTNEAQPSQQLQTEPTGNEPVLPVESHESDGGN